MVKGPMAELVVTLPEDTARMVSHLAALKGESLDEFAAREFAEALRGAERSEDKNYKPLSLNNQVTS